MNLTIVALAISKPLWHLNTTSLMNLLRELLLNMSNTSNNVIIICSHREYINDSIKAQNKYPIKLLVECTITLLIIKNLVVDRNRAFDARSWSQISPEPLLTEPKLATAL